jgi:hypothetical protein
MEDFLNFNIKQVLKALARGDMELHEARWWIEQNFNMFM